jgi:nuclear cap-binding protein subunit 2
MSSACATAVFGDLAAYSGDTADNGISPFFRERRKFYSAADWQALVTQLEHSCTLYVGNLSFFTTEEQLYELFARVAPVAKLIMGLNKATKTPCGFAFVVYHSHEDAQACQRFLSGCSVDERVIRADLDPGFEEGRQYGRSRHSGGQRRDDFRKEYDAGRGGWAPPPQKDIFPMLAEHPVGTTTVAVRGGQPQGPGFGGQGRRSGGGGGYSSSGYKTTHLNVAPGLEGEPMGGATSSGRARSRSPPPAPGQRRSSRSRSRERDQERERR